MRTQPGMPAQPTKDVVLSRLAGPRQAGKLSADKLSLLVLLAKSYWLQFVMERIPE